MVVGLWNFDCGYVHSIARAHSESHKQTTLCNGQGNCYFLAAIAACAGQQNDTIIRDLIIEEHATEGLFGVKFFVNGKWITTAVDNYFPCVQDASGTWRPIFASTKEHSDQESGVKEIWPMVLNVPHFNVDASTLLMQCCHRGKFTHRSFV